MVLPIIILVIIVTGVNSQSIRPDLCERLEVEAMTLINTELLMSHRLFFWNIPFPSTRKRVALLADGRRKWHILAMFNSKMYNKVYAIIEGVTHPQIAVVGPGSSEILSTPNINNILGALGGAPTAVLSWDVKGREIFGIITTHFIYYLILHQNYSNFEQHSQEDRSERAALFHVRLPQDNIKAAFSQKSGQTQTAYFLVDQTYYQVPQSLSNDSSTLQTVSGNMKTLIGCGTYERSDTLLSILFILLGLSCFANSFLFVYISWRSIKKTRGTSKRHRRVFKHFSKDGKKGKTHDKNIKYIVDLSRASDVHSIATVDSTTGKVVSSVYTS